MNSKPIVSVLLQGGLGNQLFGYAAAFDLASRLNASLVLNTSLLYQHGFQLDAFNLSGHQIEKTRVKNGILLRNPRRKIFREKSFMYDQRINDIEGSVLLEGYFQSWKYFSATRETLTKRIFKLRNPTQDLCRLDNLLCREPFISVHIRRGDYKNLSSYHGIIPSDYYNIAAQSIMKLTGIDRFVVFSDEIGIARQVFKFADTYIGTEQLSSPPETLTLMAKGRGMIGANSSFSYWAALLQEKDSTRIFPRPWFTDLGLDTRNLLPNEFFTLGYND